MVIRSKHNAFRSSKDDDDNEEEEEAAAEGAEEEEEEAAAAVEEEEAAAVEEEACNHEAEKGHADHDVIVDTTHDFPGHHSNCSQKM